MPALSQQHCHALEGKAPMTALEADQHLPAVPGWALVDGTLGKQFDFPDFHRTMAFVNAVAWVAHVEDHHPELLVSYSHCIVRYSTHSVGGLSINDFICAAKLNALWP
jgi:4a-hydroxytetrahydrobiopterin dehydratase